MSVIRQLAATSAIVGSGLLATACLNAQQEDKAIPYDGEFPVSAYDPLFDNAPDNDDLPDENKADAIYPAVSTALVALQSPVRSQGGRGVCSIFSTVALMEHLYIKQGDIANPDFSEQYLQWSTKFEQNAFTNTEGSNASQNLAAIARYGIVTEAAWPYQSSPWTMLNDAACDGSEAQPTECYTNGHPSDDIKAAPKFKLPAGRWLNNNSIKAHITTKGTGVVIGLTFFYQAWNHRASTLPINTTSWQEGYVTYPNEDDKTASLEKRAGHSVLIVGWDDNLEVPLYDKEGLPVLDEAGNAVKEKGFYIFKNSWGTGKFGVNNPNGDGYGYISMRYVKEYATSYVSDLPVLAPPAEICDDGLDNDRDGAFDCDDSACAAHPSCQPSDGVVEYESTALMSIPDNDANGIVSELTATATGNVASLVVSVHIKHPYRGDLKVWLTHGDVSYTLHNREGGYQDDLIQTYEVTAFHDQPLAGAWSLHVSDGANHDVGQLTGWKLQATLQ